MDTLKSLAVNKSDICQTKLDIDEKTRSNLFQWNGQFSPQFIQALLEKYTEKGFHVLDPFMGSGTVLFECARLGLQSTATDVNPAAYSVAKTYQLCNIPVDERKCVLNKIENILLNLLPFEAPLFPLEKQPSDYDTIHKSLVSETERLKKESSERILLQAFSLMIDKPKLRKEPEGIIKLWEKFKGTVISLPYSEQSVSANIGDCRFLPVKDNSVDLVITSPPYINVFNYHQQYRKNTESLGWNVLESAKSEFGSNRKHRQNRFLTVIQYCLDISQCLSELIRVCKDGSRVIFVVGKESNVRGTALYNSRAVAELSKNCGMKIVLRQERVFKNKFGQMIHEDILHLTVPKQTTNGFLELARITAKHELEAAFKIAMEDIKYDIQDAINKVSEVMPSQSYNAQVKAI